MSSNNDLTNIITDITTTREHFTYEERNQVVTNIHIEATAGRNHVWGTAEDGVEKVMFSYYPDELHFTASEFEGRTVDYARDLFHDRDVEYLQS